MTLASRASRASVDSSAVAANRNYWGKGKLALPYLAGAQIIVQGRVWRDAEAGAQREHRFPGAQQREAQSFGLVRCDGFRLQPAAEPRAGGPRCPSRAGGPQGAGRRG